MLYREDLDEIACPPPIQGEGCKTELNGRCHPEAMCRPIYDSKEGTLTLVCGQCSAPIVKVKISLKANDPDYSPEETAAARTALNLTP